MIISKLTEAAFRLINKVNKINISDIPIDEHFKKEFLLPMLSKADYWLGQKYLQHIVWAASLESSRGLPLRDITLIDHGGGTGLLGLLAKEAGFGRVIYNDILPTFLDTAREVGKAIGVVHDDFVLGDFDVLIKSLEKIKSPSMVLVSADVIEHIYDIDKFLNNVPLLSSGPKGVVMSSGANFLNPKYVSWVVPFHKKNELKWQKERAEIISTAFQEISSADLRMLAIETRGLIKEEIVEVAKGYLNTGNFEKPIRPVGSFDPYSSNTCDPHSGWWEEHLLNPFACVKALGKVGFTSEVIFGHYNVDSESHVKAFIAKTLNCCISSIGNAAISIAPYYVIRGSNMGL